MNTSRWVFIYIAALAINIAGIYLDDIWLERLSKSLLMILLSTYFLMLTYNISSPFKKWIVLALFFSWTGDVLLMFQQDYPDFFLYGLASFLAAHIFYIIFFHQVKEKHEIKSRWWIMLLIVFYYMALMAILYPRLGEMRIPVPVYGIVISFMLLLALHMLFIKNKKAGQLIAVGAVLFIFSDSVLAINKFYQSFENAGILIMLTYGMAQLFIVKGAAGYIISDDKK